jgi:hypothetical protein
MSWSGRSIVATVLLAVSLGVTPAALAQGEMGPAPPAAKLRWAVKDVGQRAGFSPDGHLLFTYKQDQQAMHLLVWDLRTGRRLRSHQLPIKDQVQFDNTPKLLSGGRYFVCEPTGKPALAIDLLTGEEWRHDLTKEGSAQNYFQVSATGKYYVRYDGYSAVLFVETRTGRVVHRPEPLDDRGKARGTTFVAGQGISRDEKWGYCARRDRAGLALDVVDLQAGKVVKTFTGLLSGASGSPGHTLLSFPEPPTDAPREERKQLLQKGGPYQLRLWDLERQADRGVIPRQHHERDGRPVTITRYSPDQRFVAVWDFRPARDKTLQLWEVPTNKRLGSVALAGEPNEVQFSPDGTRLVLLDGRQQVLRLIDVAAGRQLWQTNLSGGQAPHRELRLHFTGNAKALVVTDTRAVKLLDAGDGTVIKAIAVNQFQPSFHLTPDGGHFVIRDWKPLPNKGKRDDPAVGVWRVFHLDSGREVFRQELNSYASHHFPVNGRTMIQHVVREGEFAFDLYRWDIPQP